MSFQPDLDLSGWGSRAHPNTLMSDIKHRIDAEEARIGKEIRSLALSPEAAYLLDAPTEVWGVGVVVRGEP